MVNKHEPAEIEEDEADESEDDAEAIADILLGRTRTDQSPSRASCLEEGQLAEDHDHHHQKPPSSSLLDRLGPPSLTSSDSNRADRRTQKQDDIPIPHSPKRTRRSSRSRSPPPPAAAPAAPANRNTDQRRASLSSRITLSNRHQSCSPIAPTFDVKSRCLQIDRRFSSPSTSITTARRDSRIDSHSSSSSHRTSHHHHSHSHSHSHSHHSHHPPTSHPKASNSNTIVLGTNNRSPTLKNSEPTRVSILIENLPPYSVLTPRRLYEHLINLISPNLRSEASLPYGLKLYRYARSDCLCAELKFEALSHAKNFVSKTNRLWPSIWYHSSKLPTESCRKKYMEFTLLDDEKPASWPSRYETYYPKVKSDLLDRSLTRAMEEDDIMIVEKETSPSSSSQTRQPPIPEFGRRKPSLINSPIASTSKSTKASNTLPVKSNQSEQHRSKIRATEDENSPPKKRPRTPALIQVPSIEETHEIIKNEISLLLSQSASNSHRTKDSSFSSSSSSPPISSIKDSSKDKPLSPINTHDTKIPQTNSTALSQQQRPANSLNLIVSGRGSSGSSKIPGLNGIPGLNNGIPGLTNNRNGIPGLVNENRSTTTNSKSPTHLDTKFPNHSDNMNDQQQHSSNYNNEDKEKDRMNGILLTKMLPSINLSVLQSHFMMPNRPRDFRIFDPVSISYGPFFHLNNNDAQVIEIGCLILFHHQYVAYNFERVLNLNSPFLPVQTRLVDPAQIQFLPSATTINNPPKQQQQQQQQQQAYLDSTSIGFFGTGNPFYSNNNNNNNNNNGYMDVQNQYNWTTMQREMMNQSASSPLGIGPMSQLTLEQQQQQQQQPTQRTTNQTMPYQQQQLEMMYSPYSYMNDYSTNMLGHHLPTHSHTSTSNSPLSYTPSTNSYNQFSTSCSTGSITTTNVSDPTLDLSTLLSSSSNSPSINSFSNNTLLPNLLPSSNHLQLPLPSSTTQQGQQQPRSTSLETISNSPILQSHFHPLPHPPNLPCPTPGVGRSTTTTHPDPNRTVLHQDILPDNPTPPPGLLPPPNPSSSSSSTELDSPPKTSSSDNLNLSSNNTQLEHQLRLKQILKARRSGLPIQ
ncbi:hypothetical protein MJO28_008371 [Puccinia striiformis f. sp. tritici]|uniref:Uncharacterized protein n=1 Tax=Puccinia striiformis f. sp. tritici TaxID=168172 RepID=A0ACC0ECC0_9BASI|nr:hypothetical protein MJO28_008371 [Puccinia striiformis f. sp. tritici]